MESGLFMQRELWGLQGFLLFSGYRLDDPAKEISPMQIFDSVTMDKLMYFPKAVELLELKMCTANPQVPQVVIRDFFSVLIPPFTGCWCGVRWLDSAYHHSSPQKGSKQVADNYQPISLTSIVYKLMNKLIKTAFKGHLDHSKTVSTSKPRFVKWILCFTKLRTTLMLVGWKQVSGSLSSEYQ